MPNLSSSRLRAQNHLYSLSRKKSCNRLLCSACVNEGQICSGLSFFDNQFENEEHNKHKKRIFFLKICQKRHHNQISAKITRRKRSHGSNFATWNKRFSAETPKSRGVLILIKNRSELNAQGLKSAIVQSKETNQSNGTIRMIECFFDWILNLLNFYLQSLILLF